MGTKILKGSCHCGALQVEAKLSVDAETLSLRMCDCGFCVRHGAGYISDPGGSVRYSAKSGRLNRYKQYEGAQADFLVCNNCGVCVGTVYVDGSGRAFSSVNGVIFLGQTWKDVVPISPAKFSAEQKRGRWSEIWFGDVVVS